MSSKNHSSSMDNEGAQSVRPTPPEQHELIAANARFWAAEDEVCATYFRSPARSAATDVLWLARQCYKEMIDGVVARLAASAPADFASTAATATAGLADAGVHAELKHYHAFAIAHRISQQAAGGDPAIGALGADWQENAELRTLRAAHIRDHGPLGARAQAFTEGGYCALYRTGMALDRSRPRDAAIIDACAQVFDDEWDHMLDGIAGLAEVPLSTADWATLRDITVAQGRLRLRMRNAQFGYPVAPERMRVLEAGALEPLPFDYARARLAAP
jgi:hypothetical protein